MNIAYNLTQKIRYKAKTELSRLKLVLGNCKNDFGKVAEALKHIEAGRSVLSHLAAASEALQTFATTVSGSHVGVLAKAWEKTEIRSTGPTDPVDRANAISAEEEPSIADSVGDSSERNSVTDDDE